MFSFAHKARIVLAGMPCKRICFFCFFASINASNSCFFRSSSYIGKTAVFLVSKMRTHAVFVKKCGTCHVHGPCSPCERVYFRSLLQYVCGLSCCFDGIWHSFRGILNSRCSCNRSTRRYWSCLCNGIMSGWRHLAVRAFFM